MESNQLTKYYDTNSLKLLHSPVLHHRPLGELRYQYLIGHTYQELTILYLMFQNVKERV